MLKQRANLSQYLYGSYQKAIRIATKIATKIADKIWTGEQPIEYVHLLGNLSTDYRHNLLDMTINLIK